MRNRIGLIAALVGGLACATLRAAVKVDVDHVDAAKATAAFHFPTVPPPAPAGAADNLAAKATFTLVDGERDDNGGDLDALHDGHLPAEADDPAANFFFNADTAGGRVRIDLGAVADVRRVSTYSWHTDTRGPQVYALYAADGHAPAFDPKPAAGVDPATHGWTLVARVDTRPKDAGNAGGQYGVNLSDPAGRLGRFRYLLLDASRTESDDAFGNTFYSEIDVIGTGGELVHGAATRPAATLPGVKTVSIAGGKYVATIDTTDTPDLTDWADHQLAPVVADWYPRIVALLPSPGYEAPARFSITFHDAKDGVADTAGGRINCAAKFFRVTQATEAKGAIVHEMVHVVQNYWRGPRVNHHAKPNPGWLTEGIADYVRWYVYEPGSGGANIRTRDVGRVHYDNSYRVTANFLNWASTHYDKGLVPALNAAMRDGNYSDDLWTRRTGHAADDLGELWKAQLANRRPASAPH